MSDVDIVACNFRERSDSVFPFDKGLPSVRAFLERPELTSYGPRETIASVFDEYFSCGDIAGKLRFYDHHVCHFMCVQAFTELEQAAGLALDGSGDGRSGMMTMLSPDKVEIIEEYDIEVSLGNLYSDLIRFIGYNRFDEYKVMGLAPYGDESILSPLFDEFVGTTEDGEIRVETQSEIWNRLHELGIAKKARRKSEEFSKIHRDFAAALQATTESICANVIERTRRITGLDDLVLVGGVAHNSRMNGKIARDCGFKRVIVPPTPHDAGGALGAAIKGLSLIHISEPTRPY